MSETESPVLMAREGPVVRVTLNRPARRNAMNGAMMTALDGVLDMLEGDRSARVVIFSGAGGHFCAGLDLTEVGSQQSLEERIAAGLERNRLIGVRFQRLSALPQAVIAAVQGSAHVGAWDGCARRISPSPLPMHASRRRRCGVAWSPRRSCPGWSAAWAAAWPRAWCWKRM